MRPRAVRRPTICPACRRSPPTDGLRREPRPLLLRWPARRDARKKEPEDAGSSWKIRGARPAGGKRAGVDRLFARRDARRTDRRRGRRRGRLGDRSEEHTSELQSLMRISYAVFCLKKTKHMKQY